MSFKSLLLTLSLALVVILFVGCAKPPEVELANLNTVLTAAKDAEANRYLPELFNAAQDSLNAATTEIETQKSKFFLTRSYGKAKQLIVAATALATDAKDKVAAKKAEVKAEAEKLVADYKVAAEETKKLMKKAPRGKEGRAALEAMTNECKAVDASFVEVATLLTNGDFLSARDKAAAGLQKVNSINEELKQAIAKKSGKK
jgi:hypothetical protein